MRKNIKRYELNDNVTLNNFISNNFKEGGFMKDVPSPKYYYYQKLLKEIELYIEISVNKDKTINFDDFKNILVLDDSFCQPYYPFYEGEIEFEFLNKVIENYNKAMDEFVEKGIFREKIVKDEKILTKKVE